jgi:hypothetical protein
MHTLSPEIKRSGPAILLYSVCPKTLLIVISTERRNLVVLQRLNNRSFTSVRDDSLASFRTDTIYVMPSDFAIAAIRYPSAHAIGQADKRPLVDLLANVEFCSFVGRELHFGAVGFIHCIH